MTEHQGWARALIVHRDRRIISKPLLRALFQGKYRTGSHIAQHDSHSSRRFVSIDLVVEVEPIGQ